MEGPAQHPSSGATSAQLQGECPGRAIVPRQHHHSFPALCMRQITAPSADHPRQNRARQNWRKEKRAWTRIIGVEVVPGILFPPKQCGQYFAVFGDRQPRNQGTLHGKRPGAVPVAILLSIMRFQGQDRTDTVSGNTHDVEDLPLCRPCVCGVGIPGVCPGNLADAPLPVSRLAGRHGGRLALLQNGE